LKNQEGAGPLLESKINKPGKVLRSVQKGERGRKQGTKAKKRKPSKGLHQIHPYFHGVDHI
jgi:hypothetical protein